MGAGGLQTTGFLRAEPSGLVRTPSFAATFSSIVFMLRLLKKTEGTDVSIKFTKRWSMNYAVNVNALLAFDSGAIYLYCFLHYTDRGNCWEISSRE